MKPATSATRTIVARATALLALLLLPVASPAQQPAARRTAGERAGEVTIYRDEWGVPHIYAGREEDGFYALGYAQAQDQLEELLQRYVFARGEMALAFGADSAASDIEGARWRHLEEARRGFRRLSPRLRKNYRSFIAGIRRYMEEHPEQVPSWAPRLEPALPVAFGRAVTWYGRGLTGVDDCRRGGVGDSAFTLAAIERADPPRASNQWVLMPWRTAMGATVLLSDPHGALEGLSRRYEYTLEAGPLKISGGTYLGWALPITGHTRHVAWALTTGFPDVGDCIEVEVDSTRGRRYRYDGQWKRMTTQEARIAVRGGDTLTRVFEYTDHNGVTSPVVAREGTKAYVVSSPYMHDADGFDEQFYRQVLARDVDEFHAAMGRLGMWAENVMAADAKGNTFYVRNGRTPIRPAGYDWSKPVPGNTSATRWRGIHPLDDLVWIKSPPQGYMQNNNIAPDRMIEGSPLTADRYPPYIFGDTPGRINTRGLRAVELLSGTFHATLDDVVRIALDEKWVGTEAWVEVLRRALNADPSAAAGRSAEFRRFVDPILTFDGQAHHESAGALHYYYWRTQLDSVPGLSAAEREAVSGAVEAGTELTPAQSRALLDGAGRAMAVIRERHGAAELRHGDVFRIGRGGHSWPVGGGAFEAGNRSIQPLRLKSFTPPDSNGHRWVNSGPKSLWLVVFTDPIQSFTAVLPGQSNDPRSPHYSDQARLVSERRLKPVYFRREEAMKHAVRTTTLDVPSPSEDRR